MNHRLQDTLVCACAGAARPGPLNPGFGARRRLPRKSRRAVCVLFAGLVVLGCGGDSTGPEREYLWSEDRGIALTPANVEVWAPLAWSAGGGEIFFHSPGGIQAVEISGGSIRVVDNRHSGYSGLSLSANGERVYFAAWDGDDPIGLYSVSVDGAESDLLASGLAYESPLAVSPDDVDIAYRARGDSAFIHNMTDHSTIFVNTGKPLTFSSDGTELLFGCRYWPGYGGAPPCATFAYNLETQQSEHVLDADYHIEMLRWDPDAIRVLTRDFDRLTVWNVTHDVARELTLSMRDDEQLGYTYAWSFDGSMIAVWTGRCIERSGFLGECVKGESRLHVVYTDGRGDAVVAVVHKNVGPTALASGSPSYCAEIHCDWMIFSPDGSRIAYSRDDRIYMKDLP
jgi:hypothetical protein